MLDRIKAILAAYRKDDLADPDGWTVQVATLLATFPKEVVDFVTDPITGIQSHVKYGVPNLADIREACDERMAQLRVEFDRTRPRLPEPEIDRSNRPTLDELRAKFGPNWGLSTVDDILGSSKP